MRVVPTDVNGRIALNSRLIRFDLTRELEGFYSCKVDNVTSDNEVELVGKHYRCFRQ